MNNPFQYAARIPFPNNNNNNRRLALDRQEAMNVADIQRAIDEMHRVHREENAMAPKTPMHRNKRARMSN